jgi:hypothetical protein
LPESDRAKIALFCNVRKEAVISALDAESIYEVPLQYHAEGLDDEVLNAFAQHEPARPLAGGLVHGVALAEPARLAEDLHHAGVDPEHLGHRRIVRQMCDPRQLVRPAQDAAVGRHTETSLTTF